MIVLNMIRRPQPDFADYWDEQSDVWLCEEELINVFPEVFGNGVNENMPERIRLTASFEQRPGSKHVLLDLVDREWSTPEMDEPLTLPWNTTCFLRKWFGQGGEALQLYISCEEIKS